MLLIYSVSVQIKMKERQKKQNCLPTKSGFTDHRVKLYEYKPTSTTVLCKK
jgi:hypothetical protein